MSLADRVKTRTGPIHGYPCSVGNALAKLPEAERAVLLADLGTPEDRGTDAPTIYADMQAERRELIAAGKPELAAVYDIKLQTINRHRGGKCRCYRDPS